jgi:hypothetical protein
MFPWQENTVIMEETFSMQSTLKRYNQSNCDEVHVRKKERGDVSDLNT